ncbi:MAG TPA: hypothetical protein VFH68_16535 [Polyangia bacterium]|jgi:hypothetical protein|nr:hypothetical protein [Polyangia bacterium]
MAESNSLKGLVPHTGRGRWVAGVFAALVFVVALIWIMTSAFEGRHIRRNADALTSPIIDQPASTSPDKRLPNHP